MSLLRFVARSLFASYFIVDGLRAATKPTETAPEAEAFVEKAVPLVQRIVPAPYSSSVPEDATQWVRISGAAKVLGGVMFATGVGRRLGAVLLAKACVLDVAIAWPAKDAPHDERKSAQKGALRHLALLGGALLASQDLQGKPSVGWRAEQKSKVAAKQASELGDKVGKMSKKAKKRARKLAKGVTR